jgi:surfeit locus 1 family protein
MPQAATPETVQETAPATPAPKADNRLTRLWARFSLRQWLASRRFGAVATTIALLCTIILLGLGGWQLHRLHWKNDLLIIAQKDFAKAPADLRQHPPVSDSDWSALHYKPVIVKGHWLAPFHAIKMGPRTYKEQAGYQLVIPLQLPDNQVVLIDRGFAPDKMGVLPPAIPEITIHGVAYQPETTKPYFMPENIPSRSQWIWPDIMAMGHEIGRDHIAPVMIFEDQIKGNDNYPIGGQLPLPSLNSHRQYAITWFALAFALIGVWLMASNPKPEKETTLPAGKEKETTDPVAKRGMYPEATD